jgi:hypothetical protein
MLTTEEYIFYTIISKYPKFCSKNYMENCKLLAAWLKVMDPALEWYEGYFIQEVTGVVNPPSNCGLHIEDVEEKLMETVIRRYARNVTSI